MNPGNIKIIQSLSTSNFYIVTPVASWLLVHSFIYSFISLTDLFIYSWNLLSLQYVPLIYKISLQLHDLDRL